MGTDRQIVVRTIWQGEENNAHHRIYLAPDGVGTCFTTVQDMLYFPINSSPAQAHLLRIHLPTQKSSPLYHTDGSITGITHRNAQEILLIVSRSESDYLVTLSSEGRLLQQVTIGEREAGRRTVRIYAAPPYWMQMLDTQTVLIYSYGGDSTLFAFSLQGFLKHRWHRINGVALAPKKRQVYIDGEAEDSKFPLMKAPRTMKSPTWRLVGTDQRQQFYWYRSTRDRSWLACTGHNRIRWLIPLRGDDGVLDTRYRTLRFHLGWGGDMLEVLPDGRVWFSAASLAGDEPTAMIPSVCEVRVFD
jgi:hypothetical protein